jgi:hypothetical protein
MDGDVLAFAQVMTVIVLSVGSFVAIGLGARALWLRGSHPKPRAISSAVEDRLERLEVAVDTIAVEVERISEAQRFAVTLLAERLPPRAGERVGELAPPGAAKRVNTPH